MLHRSSIGVCLGLLIASSFGACTVDKGCRQDMAVRVGMQLIGDSLRLAADSITWEHVQFKQTKQMAVWGAGRDEHLITDGSESVSTLYLPLRKDADTTAYVLQYRGQTDTLIFAYAREDNYVSLACGCAVFATLDTIFSPTSQFVDSVLLLDASVTTQKETHIQVYFHVPQNN